MTGRTAGGRPAAEPSPFSVLPVLSVLLALLALLAGCGAASPTAPPAAPSASGSAAASDGASGRPTPRPTAWPGNAVLGIEALGVGDGEIRKGIADFSRAVAEEDLALMRHAAAGLAGVDVLLPNVDRIEIFPPMQPMAASLRDVLPRMAESSRRLRDAIDGGDGEAIGDASLELTRALTDYARIQPDLAAWVEQSIDQQRLLVR